MATFVCASSQGQRTHSARTKRLITKNSGLRLSDTVCTAPLGPIEALFTPVQDIAVRYHVPVFCVLSKSTPSVAHLPVRVATVKSANRTLLTTLTSMLSSTMAVSFAIKSPKESQISSSLPWILQRRNIQVYFPPAVVTAITDVPSHHILSVLVTNYLLSSSRCGVKRERNG